MCKFTSSTLALAIGMALASQPVQSANFSVVNSNDSGPGSLRQALLDAQANAEADIVELSSISGQTINLTSGQLEISGDVISIQGSHVTLDAVGNSRVLYIAESSSVVMNDLTITGGYAFESDDFRGGGILSNESDLRMQNVSIESNAAIAGGGAFVFGNDLEIDLAQVSIRNNTAAGNRAAGGGLLLNAEESRITISNSVFEANSAAYSLPETPQLSITENSVSPQGVIIRQPFFGGLWIYARSNSEVSIQDVLITENQASYIGGIEVIADVGAVVDISNVTISNNEANRGAGGYIFAEGLSQVRFSNTTISGNSGQIDSGLIAWIEDGAELEFEALTVTDNTDQDANSFSAPGLNLVNIESSLRIHSSVIAGNRSPNNNDLVVFTVGDADASTMNYSLVGSEPLGDGINMDALSQSLLGQNPLLAPLTDNGGFTPTHLPFADSPLLDMIPVGQAGCGTMQTSDQRGELRPQGDGCDIGAVEGSGPFFLPQAQAVPVMNRWGIPFMAALLGLAGLLGFWRSRRSQI